MTISFCQSYNDYLSLKATVQKAKSKEIIKLPKSFLEFLTICQQKGLLNYTLFKEQEDFCKFIEATEGEPRALFGLRGCGKSELITEYYVAYSFLGSNNINKRIIIAKAADRLGKFHIDKIVRICDALPDLYPQVIANETEIFFNTRLTHTQPSVKIVIASSPRTMKTLRADFVIMDDVETYSDFESNNQRAKTKNAVNAILGLFPAGARHNYVVVGQVMHPQGYHNELRNKKGIKTFELWQDTKTLDDVLRKDLIDEEQKGVLLPQEHPFNTKLDVQLSMWQTARELFCVDYLGILPNDLLSPFIDIKTTSTVPTVGSNIIVAIDPSFEGKDTTAISAVYISKGCYFVIGKVWKADYVECLPEMVEMIRDLATLRLPAGGVVKVVYEGNGGAGAGLGELLKSYKIFAKKVINTENKVRRINGLLPFIKNMLFLDSPDTYHYVQQVRAFNHFDSKKSFVKGYNDDAIDSLATCFMQAGIIKK